MTLATMRLGGMTPAEHHCELPAVFHISRILEHGNLLTFFCNHNDRTGKVLVWASEDIIVIDDKCIRLNNSPSYRTSWCTFTIRPLTIFENKV